MYGDTDVHGMLLCCSLSSRAHTSIGFRCIMRRFSGTYASCQYPGILAHPSARRDALPGPASRLPVDTGAVPRPTNH